MPPRGEISCTATLGNARRGSETQCADLARMRRMTDLSSTADAAILDAYRAHYVRTFSAHGPTSRGVDWGAPGDVDMRYGKMLEVLEPDAGVRPSLLDVGCGYGGLLDYADARGIALDYSGVDIVPKMIAHARAKHPSARFEVADALALPDAPVADYVVCNGILTLKLEASILDMDRFARRLIRKMFTLARRGIAFNMMTSHVNFMAPTLYYKNPLEIAAFVSGELSNRFRLDHSYPAYEFTVYVFPARSQP
ncbi:MAG: class I SAM-dependent methyltransferase [Hyphomicrobiales bacterium]|nr:class I SAM-dependent methyltransferase [Hyphomicrobiales bacterium]MDE2017240.1 class I SAM-dependent methyltransferase [Hyphomicrobiales bacterium]